MLGSSGGDDGCRDCCSVNYLEWLVAAVRGGWLDEFNPPLRRVAGGVDFSPR